jgi:hypothetical protein
MLLSPTEAKLIYVALEIHLNSSVQRLAFIIERTMIIAKMFLMEGNLECREANAL